MFGCNDNPSARQLESAWRKLLGQHQIAASESANCLTNDVPFLSVLNASSRKPSNILNNEIPLVIPNEILNNEIPNEIEVDFDMAENAHIQSLINDETLSVNLEEHIASYLASVLEKCIIERRWYSPINCKKCLLVFAEDETIDDQFVNLKMKSSKLLPPARSTVKICKAIEHSMKIFNYEPGKFNDIQNDVLSRIDFNDLFWMSDFESYNGSEHKTILIRLIIEMYIKKKQDYISKCNTLAEHDVLLRNQLKKLIHFKGQ